MNCLSSFFCYFNGQIMTEWDKGLQLTTTNSAMQVTSFKVDNVVSVPYVRMNLTDDVLAWEVSDCYDVSDAHPITSNDSGVKINSPLGIIAWKK